jgi:hypothetical protein
MGQRKKKRERGVGKKEILLVRLSSRFPFFHTTTNSILIGKRPRREKELFFVHTDCSNDQIRVRPKEYGSNSYQKKRAVATTALFLSSLSIIILLSFYHP